MIKTFIIRLFYFELSNYRLGRKFIGGVWYRMQTGLSMGPVWSQHKFKSCQAYCIETENHGLCKLKHVYPFI